MKRKSIITSALVIVLCLGLISGSTFALFTSTSSVNIAVTSGKVKLTATLADPTLYSANATITTGDKAVKTTDTSTSSADGTLTGTFAGTYYYQPQTGTFLNGGTAEYTAPTLTIDKMTPGDKVTTTLSIGNESNVAIQYRLRIDADANANEDLLSVLKVEFNGKLYTGLNKFTSAWTKVDAPTSTTTPMVTKDISIIFPLDIDGEEYMNKTVSFVVLVEAVQSNANTSGDEEVETILGKTTNYAPATAQLTPGTNDENAKTQADSVQIVSTDIVATSTIPGDTVFYMDDPGTSVLIPLGDAEGDGSLSRLISTTATSETTAVIDISYKYTDSDGDTTDVTGFSNVVTNVVNVGANLYQVTVTRTHNGTTVQMTEGFDANGEGFLYDVNTGLLTIKSKLYSDYNMTFVTPAAKVVSDTATTYYERLDTALDANTVDTTVVLLKDYELPVDYTPVSMFEGTFDGQNHKIYTEKAISANFVLESLTKTVTVKDLTIAAYGHLVMIADDKYDYTAVTFDNVDYVALDDTYYQLDHNGSLYTTYCYDYNYGWRGTVTIKNCDVNMNLKGATSSNSAVFFGGYYYAYSDCILSVIDCSYTGTFIGNYVALVLSNGQHYEKGTTYPENMTITGLKNKGTLIGTNGAYAVGGQNHNGEAGSYWLSVYDGIQETAGGSYIIMDNTKLSGSINEDKTVKIVDNGVNAASYQVLLYASRKAFNSNGNYYASKFNYGITFNVSAPGDTQIKKLKMVDYDTAIEGQLIVADDCTDSWIEIDSTAKYQIVTKNEISYYVIKLGVGEHGDTYKIALQDATVLISAYDADGLLKAVAEF